MQKNIEVRSAAASAGLKLWQIAYALGVNDGNFFMKLRKEFTPEEKERILEIIDRISKEA